MSGWTWVQQYCSLFLSLFFTRIPPLPIPTTKSLACLICLGICVLENLNWHSCHHHQLQQLFFWSSIVTSNCHVLWFLLGPHPTCTTYNILCCWSFCFWNSQLPQHFALLELFLHLWLWLVTLLSWTLSSIHPLRQGFPSALCSALSWRLSTHLISLWIAHIHLFHFALFPES